MAASEGNEDALWTWV